MFSSISQVPPTIPPRKALSEPLLGLQEQTDLSETQIVYGDDDHDGDAKVASGCCNINLAESTWGSVLVHTKILLLVLLAVKYCAAPSYSSRNEGSSAQPSLITILSTISLYAMASYLYKRSASLVSSKNDDAQVQGGRCLATLCKVLPDLLANVSLFTILLVKETSIPLQMLMLGSLVMSAVSVVRCLCASRQPTTKTWRRGNSEC